MRVVVADTSPLQYLVLTGDIDLLPRLFEAVAIPAVVHAEMLHRGAPPAVRMWAGAPPRWLTVSAATKVGADLPQLDAGEHAAITLALAIGAELILLDDRAGVAAALAQGLAVIGTLGVLDRAARRGLVDLETAFTRLQATNFRYPPALLDTMLAEWRRDRGA